MVIVIDGPAGSGKSSTARAVAKKLGIQYIDSGALYRAVTLVYINEPNEKVFFERLKQIDISFHYSNEIFEVFIGDENVTDELRKPFVADKVSSVAAMSRVRSFVNAQMRKAVEHGVYIADGRDLGTAVFPDAAVKIFMVADIEKRAKRRFLELQESKADTNIQEVQKNILSRDEKDSNRKEDPLKQAADAVVIDTSGLDFDEQVDKVCSIIQAKTRINTKQKP